MAGIYFGGDNLVVIVVIGVTLVDGTGAGVTGVGGGGGVNNKVCNVDSDGKLFTDADGEVSMVIELLVLRVGLSDDIIASVEAWQRGDFLELRTGLERDRLFILSIS